MLNACYSVTLCKFKCLCEKFVIAVFKKILKYISYENTFLKMNTIFVSKGNAVCRNEIRQNDIVFNVLGHEIVNNLNN